MAYENPTAEYDPSRFSKSLFLSSDVVMVGEREGGGRWERGGGREIAVKFYFYKQGRKVHTLVCIPWYNPHTYTCT